MNLNERFPEKRVLITGAGSGIGKALAIEFAKMNWRVAVAEISRERAKEAVADINKAGGRGIDIPCDVTKPEDFVTAAAVVKKEWGGLDILVNNAGVAAAGFFEEIPLEKWEWIMAINQKSIIYGCRTFIPLFKERKAGYIVNVASNAGIASLPEMVSYNMTKAAAISMSETLRSELSPHNIGVSVICPTFVHTNLFVDSTAMNQNQHKLVDTFFGDTAVSSEKIARHVISSIKRNRFYVITQSDGKFMWRMKRWYPELYFKVFSYLYRKGLFYKYQSALLRILNLKIF